MRASVGLLPASVAQGKLRPAALGSILLRGGSAFCRLFFLKSELSAEIEPRLGRHQ